MATLTSNLVLAKTKLDSLDVVRKLNLWGADLADLSLVVEIPHLEVLSLSVNRVSSLDYVCDCPNLQELYLRKNDIASFDEVRKLSRLKNLRTLWLADNPVAALPQYRSKVLQFCPKLEILDTVEVSPQERAEAAKVVHEAPQQSTPQQSPQRVAIVQAPPPRQPDPRVRSPPPPTSDQSQRNILSAIVALLGELTPQSLGMLKEEVDGKLRAGRSMLRGGRFLHSAEVARVTQGPVKWKPKSNRTQAAIRYLMSSNPFGIRHYFPENAYMGGPVAAVREQPHGGTHVDGGVSVLPPDQYAYMQDLNDPDTRAYIASERRSYNMISMRMNTQSSKFRLWGEQDSKVIMTSRKGGYDDGEERIGNYLYVTREVGNHGEVAYYRKRYGQVDLLSEELINPQTLKQQFGYAACNLGVIRVSADGRYLAYTISVDGSDRYICHVKSIGDASLFHVIKGANIMSIEFGTANRFFYTDSNELNRPNRVMMVHLQPGLLPQPTEVYRDDDERFFVDVRRTKDSEYLIISSDSRDMCSAWVAPASYPVIPHHLKPLFDKPAFVEVVPKKCWTWLDHYDGSFVMVSGDVGDNHRILYTRDEVALKDSTNAQWKELLPIRDDVVITDIDLFRGMMIVFEQSSHFDRQQQIRTIDLSGGLDAASSVQARSRSDGLLHFPPLCQVTPGLNRNWNSDSMQFMFSSIVQPVKECVFHFKNHMPADKSRLVAPQALMNQRQHDEFTPFDYDWPYHSHRDVCESADGTQVPLSIFHMRDMFVEQTTDFDAASNTPKPCILYVYGSYGEVPAMHFQTCPYMWLLRRRFTVVFAHVRGGGEIPGWADKGRHKNKMRTVEDFTAACEHMVAAGYTTAEQLIVVGTSAGAVPIGAAMNSRGDSLFGTAWLRSPFLDIASTMCDPSLPLTIAERREWGDPLNNQEDRELILKYDPYQNINTRVRYPTVIVSTCLDDDRVAPWNALKYVAKLRAARDAQERAAGFPIPGFHSSSSSPRSDPCANPIILRVEEHGGHQYWSENIQVNEELAFLCNLHDLEGSERTALDMDNQRLMENQVKAGMIDEDDAKKAFLRWEDWEEERMDFHRKLVRMEFEPGYRAVKQTKAPHFWVPSEEELEEKVNEDLSEKGRRARYEARSAKSEQEWNEHTSTGERSKGDRGGI